MKNAKRLNEKKTVILNYRKNVVVEFIIIDEHYAFKSTDCGVKNNRNFIWWDNQKIFVDELKNFSTKQAFKMLDKFNASQAEAYQEQCEINNAELENVRSAIAEREENREENDNTVYADGEWIRQIENNNLHFYEEVNFSS